MQIWKDCKIRGSNLALAKCQLPRWGIARRRNEKRRNRYFLESNSLFPSSNLAYLQFTIRPCTFQYNFLLGILYDTIGLCLKVCSLEHFKLKWVPDCTFSWWALLPYFGQVQSSVVWVNPGSGPSFHIPLVHMYGQTGTWPHGSSICELKPCPL